MLERAFWSYFTESCLLSGFQALSKGSQSIKAKYHKNNYSKFGRRGVNLAKINVSHVSKRLKADIYNVNITIATTDTKIKLSGNFFFLDLYIQDQK